MARELFDTVEAELRIDAETCGARFNCIVLRLSIKFASEGI